MFPVITYTTGSGDIVYLDGGHSISGRPNSFQSFEYSFDEALGISSASLARGSFDVSTVSMSEAAAKFMVAAFMSDSEAKRYGILRVGNSWIRCFVSKWKTNRIRGAISITLTLTARDSFWRTDGKYDFTPSERSGGANYPHNYLSNYGSGGVLSAIYVESPIGADPIIKIYGPASNPEITIGDNVYKVNVNVEDGSVLTIDSVSKTVKMVDQNGTETNEFANAVRGAGAGKGSYIFEMMKPGENDIGWNQSFKFELTACDREAMPEWIL